MKSDMVEKRILEVDGEALEGLVSVDEYPLEEGTVDIPGQTKTVPVKNGVTKIPPVNMVFKITRNSKTLKTLQNWKNKNEYHDCTMIVTDGSGNEIYRELWDNVECSKYAGPAYDASSPVFSQVAVTLLPEDIDPIDPE
jgi:hypothetical protein